MMKKAVLWVLTALVSAGCASRLAPPDMILLDDGSLAPAAWAGTLESFVDVHGRIDFSALEANPKGLEVFVRSIADRSPSSAPEKFMSRESKIAFYVNAYNALAMYSVIHAGTPPDLSKVRSNFFSRTKLDVGGMYLSLDEIESRILRPMDEPRIHFALNGMARGYPRLARQPFSAAGLDSQLDRQAREFFSEDRNVVVDAEKRIVHFSQILESSRDDFLKKAPSLIAYANLYRDNKIPESYQVAFIAFDWSLNRP